MTNRELILKTDICDLLTVIHRNRANYNCIIDGLNAQANLPYKMVRKCAKPCHDCISAWLNEEAAVPSFVKEVSK